MLCGTPHDGGPMRYDQRYSTVPDMLAEMPKRPDGGVQVCRMCQRRAYFAGGFTKLLARSLTQLATVGYIYK